MGKSKGLFVTTQAMNPVKKEVVQHLIMPLTLCASRKKKNVYPKHILTEEE